MQACSYRPYEDGDEVALLRSHPVDELSGEEVGNGIEQREHAGDGAVVAVGPMEVGSDEVFPGERQHLTVHVVNCCRKEQQSADDPAEIAHFYCLYGSHVLFRYFVIS